LVLWKDQRIDDAAVPYLNAIPRIEYLDVEATRISGEAKRSLKASRLR